MRHLRSLLLTALAALAVAALAGAPAFGALGSGAVNTGPVDVVQVTGRIDPVTADLVVGALRRAERRHVQVVVIQLDSPGALDVDALRVWKAIELARVPVAVWVGPSGAQAGGAAAFMLEAAAIAAVAPGAHVGPAVPLGPRATAPVGPLAGEAPRSLSDELRRLAAAHRRSEDVAEDLALHEQRLPAADVARRGGVDLVEPTLGGLLVTLDGREVGTPSGSHTLHTARVVSTSKGPRRQPLGPVRFVKLDLGSRLQHALIGPGIAYLLLLIGLGLIAFEFFAASVGVAGAVGALALLAALFGFSHLPVHIWALAVAAVGVVAYCIDVQAATTGFWTAVGTVAMLAAGFGLYGGGMRVAWWQVVVLTVLVLFFFVAGLSSVVRARFSTPTLGRESMIGEMGEARAAVSPDGVVEVRGALWRARTNRATPIGEGDRVRVIAVDGLVLEVEPEVGGARDAGH